jgi:branched-chain amino acid transport system substrate-binding protein
MKKFVTMGALILGLLLFLSNGYAQDIKLGWVGPLTGPAVDTGVNMKNGSMLALEEINASGGVLGKKIVLIMEDDAGVPAQAVNAVQKLVDKDKVIGVVGALNSSSTLASMEVTQRAKIPQITPISIADKITESGNPFIFRNVIRVKAYTPRFVKFFMTTFNAKNVAFLLEANDYGKSVEDVSSPAVVANSGKVVAKEYFKPGATDFYTLLTKLNTEKPDLLICVGLGTPAAQMVKQIQEIGMKVRVFGYGGFSTAQYIEQAGKGAENTWSSAHFDAASQEPMAAKFIATYKKKFGTDPDIHSASGYDTVYIFAEAIKRANSLDPIAIRDSIKSLKDLPGIQGLTTFDENGDILWRNIVLSQVQNGQHKFVVRFEKDKEVVLQKFN